MDSDECKQWLEDCLHIEEQCQSSDIEVMGELLKDFKSEMAEIVDVSAKFKIGFAKQARAVLDKSKDETLANRERINNQIKRVVFRASSAIVLTTLVFLILSNIKKSVDTQVCEYFNIQGRTARYETQKPCQR